MCRLPGGPGLPQRVAAHDGRNEDVGGTGDGLGISRSLAARRDPAAAAGPATLALRPHRLRLLAPEASALVGTCKRCDYLGSHNEVLVQTPWGELLVFSDADATAAPAAGAPVGVGFDAGDAIVLAR